MDKLGSKTPTSLRKGRPLDTNVSALFLLCRSSRITLASPRLQGRACFRFGLCLAALPSAHYSTWVQAGGVYTAKVGVCVPSCLSLSDSFQPVDYSPRSSSVPGILQARILEWIAVPSSRGSSPPRDQTCVSYVSCISSWFFTTCATREAPIQLKPHTKCNSAICYIFLLNF